MLLMITHRVDLAKEIATKRYHIQNGELSQVPLEYNVKDNRVEDEAVQPEV